MATQDLLPNNFTALPSADQQKILRPYLRNDITVAAQQAELLLNAADRCEVHAAEAASLEEEEYWMDQWLKLSTMEAQARNSGADAIDTFSEVVVFP